MKIVQFPQSFFCRYYTKIRLSRMSNLLALSENETEDCLSDMVVAGTVSAKTDRLEGIVDFTEQEVNWYSFLHVWMMITGFMTKNSIALCEIYRSIFLSGLKSWWFLLKLNFLLIRFHRKASPTLFADSERLWNTLRLVFQRVFSKQCSL